MIMALKLDQMLNTTGATGITTAYSTAKAIPLQYTKYGTAQIAVMASMLEVQLSNISGANKIYASLSRDEAGDNLIMTETRSDVQTGITTNTKGALLYRLDVILRDIQDKTLYLHIRTNAGTCDVSSASLTYQY